MADTKPTPTPAPSPVNTGALGPSAAAQSAANTAPAGTGSSSGKSSLIPGVSLGTKILKGQETKYVEGGRVQNVDIYGTVQYYKGAGATVFATLNNQGKINLLAQLAQIPGVYSKGKAPTKEYLLRLAGSSQIALRQEDYDALENVMKYADTVGDDYQTSIKFLTNNQNIANSFFNAPKSDAPKQVRVTPGEALSLELEQTALDYLDLKLTKEEKKKYVDKVNALEIKRGGALTSLERQLILTDTIQDKALELYKSEANNPDSLLLERGALGSTYRLIRDNYAQYGLPLDDKSIYKQAVKSIRSKQALENIMGEIRLRAEVTMPALKDYIRQGLSPQKALSSYTSLYSKIYGVPQESVSLEKLAPVYSGDKLMPINEWQKYLYSLPEFRNTELYSKQRLDDTKTLVANFLGGI